MYNPAYFHYFNFSHSSYIYKILNQGSKLGNYIFVSLLSMDGSYFLDFLDSTLSKYICMYIEFFL
jgi:hypothetical protein